MASANMAIVVGGAGFLGSSILRRASLGGMTPISIDFKESKDALWNVIIKRDQSLQEQGKEALAGLRAMPGGGLGFDGSMAGLLCSAAGSWMGGGLSVPPPLPSNRDQMQALKKMEGKGNQFEEYDAEHQGGLLGQADHMWKANTSSAFLTCHLARLCLGQRGMLVLVGAQAASGPCSTMLAYGASKAAVHHLVGSVALTEVAVEKEWSVAGILPSMIDTPLNREFIADADFTSWTKPDDIADKCFEWTKDEEKRIPQGQLLQAITSNNITTWTAL